MTRSEPNPWPGAGPIPLETQPRGLAVVQPGHSASGQVGNHLLLLGGFRLEYDGAPLALPVHAQRLLAFVALHDQVSRVMTAGMLWPDVTEQRASGNLRSTVWRLQRLCPSIVLVSRNLLRLSPSVTVDVRECQVALAALAEEPGEAGVSELSEGSFCGELLPGWYEDWVLRERDRWQHLRLHALEEAADRLLRHGRYGEALKAALAAARSDPLRESARRLILRVHVAQGNRVEALRQFQSYRSLLAAEMGIEPSPHTWALLSAAD